jgi:hypothetical protein
MTTDTQIVQHIHQAQPVSEKITLTRGQKGSVGWEIQAGSVARALELDAELRAALGAEKGEG